ncbi:PRC-barrel domain-containing protein [Patulibacter brassicae]|uniref:PRC-barrel domain-containing protein n=1 Tax=Patulibacter brassicae TaxID=1705717 RepID=A0ABU4VEM3_9ACTN|nr:PRC-barrel domain-containing protein [Patulibacter brassicae]MDX8150164.1 PRC-barrel domain-containing protein [Patulibacter brassicae]
MQEIESIEDWKGQDVLDVAEEKVGKLEDAWFPVDAPEAVLLSVRSGLIAKKRFLVPLAGATVSRSHVRVAFTKDQIADGPRNDGDDRLSAEELAAVIAHYGVDVDGAHDAELESGAAREARVRAAREARAAADEAERSAETAAEEADRAEAAAREARTAADAAAERRSDALARAQELRRRADELAVPEPRTTMPPGVDR